VRTVCSAGDLPVIAKLTPNVTSVIPIAQAVADAGADAVSLINTFQGMAIDWKKRQPVLGNVLGGLSGPAIKPLALRIVWQVAQAVKIPIIGVGGIQCSDWYSELLQSRTGKLARHRITAGRSGTAGCQLYGTHRYTKNPRP
jgi:dihydroorotate dehydrogenase (NAD+) catalytic subunit